MLFPERMKAAREMFGETQEQLAEFCGVSQRTISNWERGTREPPFEKFERIAERYNVSADWLIGRNEKPRIFTYVIGQVNGKDVTYISSSPTPPLDEEKAKLLAEADNPVNAKAAKPKTLQTDKAEIEAMLRKILIEALTAHNLII